MKRATQSAGHALRLKEEAGEAARNKVRAQLLDYCARAGLSNSDFAHRIDYSPNTLKMFVSEKYHHISGTGRLISDAITNFIARHPIEPPQEVVGSLYDTANVRTIRETFQKLLPRPVAYMIYAPPGSQKSFVLEHEVARLNRSEMSKNGHGRRAYYVYARQNLRPRDLVRRIAIVCGSRVTGDIDTMLSNLRFDFRGRRVLLVIDEAQHLSIECLEVVRELLDQPPHFSLLFSGSHDLKNTFDRFSATLEQWNSRIIAKVRLPGLLRDEAEGIVWREVGELLKAKGDERAAKKVAQLVDDATTIDAFEKGRRYINVRTLTNSLDQIKAAAVAASRCKEYSWKTTAP